EQALEGARAGAGATAAPTVQGQPSGGGRAPAASTDLTSVAEVSRLLAAAAAAWTGAQGGRAGGMQGSSTVSEHSPGLFENLVLDQVDSELIMSQVLYKQILQKNKTVAYALQVKQEVERARDLSMKNKEMSLEMERLQRENMEFSLKNKEQAMEIENLKKTLAESELVQTGSLSNRQVHEGGTSDNVPQEGLFNPDQQERVIFENHARQLELTEVRKKLKDVFTNMGHDDEGDPIIGIKMLGQINEKPFFQGLSAAQVKKAAMKCSAWQQKIEGHIWRPFKRITEDGHFEEVLDEEDETLKELKACGPDIYDSVVEALMEMEKYNASGRTIVPELWNYKEGRRASTVECTDFLGRKVMECNNMRRRTSKRLRVSSSGRAAGSQRSGSMEMVAVMFLLDNASFHLVKSMVTGPDGVLVM
ncbi:hypothetical protein EJB05_05286, partial [Eragrostis curvula]